LQTLQTRRYITLAWRLARLLGYCVAAQPCVCSCWSVRVTRYAGWPLWLVVDFTALMGLLGVGTRAIERHVDFGAGVFFWVCSSVMGSLLYSRQHLWRSIRPLRRCCCEPVCRNSQRVGCSCHGAHTCTWVIEVQLREPCLPVGCAGVVLGWVGYRPLAHLFRVRWVMLDGCYLTKLQLRVVHGRGARLGYLPHHRPSLGSRATRISNTHVLCLSHWLMVCQ